MSCSRTQHGGGRFRTQDLSLWSPTLYHWATALPKEEVVMLLWFEWPHDKTNKMACTPSEDRSAWASAQSDQSLCCELSGMLRTYAFFMRTAKTLIRLGRCWFCHVVAQLCFSDLFKCFHFKKAYLIAHISSVCPFKVQSKCKWIQSLWICQ